MRISRSASRTSAYAVVLVLTAGCGTTGAATPGAGDPASADTTAEAHAEGHTEGHEDGGATSRDAGQDEGHDEGHDDGHGGGHADAGRPGGPSEAAAMICSDEIAEAVRRSFALDTVPERHDTWETPHYTCDYHLGEDRLHLSVHDADVVRAGRLHYRQTRAGVLGAETIKGVKNFGFPAFESRTGVVGFLKDGKTLLVDAAEVPAGDLPRGFTRTEVAYAVSAAVIACWTE